MAVRDARNLAIDHTRKRRFVSLDSTTTTKTSLHRLRLFPAQLRLSSRQHERKMPSSSPARCRRYSRSSRSTGPRFQEELSLQEISQVVGASVSTVSSRIIAALQLCDNRWTEEPMQTDNHESICHLIDKSVAGDISSRKNNPFASICSRAPHASNIWTRPSERSPGSENLRSRLIRTCPTNCRGSRSRAAQLETQRLSHRKLAWSYIAALILTLAGSFAAMHLGDGLPLLFCDPRSSPAGTDRDLDCAVGLLLSVLPTLPMMSKRWMHAKGVSL